jgi:hypothetical protein
LHTAEEAAVTHQVLEIMVTTVAWVQDTIIKTVEGLVAVADLTTTGHTAEEAAEAEHLAQEWQQEIQHQAMELEAQVTQEDLVGVLEHQAEQLELITAGHRGLVWAEAEVMVNTELQEAAEAAEE